MNSVTVEKPLPRFQVGGSLSGDAYYVIREADSELYEALLTGDYCYVVAPRQIGKSSLCTHTSRRLQYSKEQDIRCVYLDLQRFGDSLARKGTAGVVGWYHALMDAVAGQLKLDPKIVSDFLQFSCDWPPIAQWSKFLEIALYNVPESAHIVIFVDEVDYTRILPFSTDEFFAAIRGAFNRRSDNAIFERLAFCLIGITPPSEVIHNPEASPFNIGKAIRLDDFTKTESLIFVEGLLQVSKNPEELLDKVFEWTDGHPYMTHRLCEKLWLSSEQGKDQYFVDKLVKELFLDRGRTDDKFFADTERRFEIKHDSPDPTIRQMLTLYRQLLKDDSIHSNKADPLQLKLRLTGIAAERRIDDTHVLRPRNKIVRSVFNEEWIRQRELPTLLTERLELWRESGKKEQFVLRGTLLEQAEEWVRGRDYITDIEKEYIFSSRLVDQRETIERMEREMSSLQTGSRWFNEIRAASLALGRLSDPSAVCDVLADRTQKILNLNVAVMIQGEHQWLSVGATRGVSTDFMQTLSGTIMQTVFAQAVAEARTFATWDLRLHNDQRIAQVARREGIITSTCTPLFFNDQAVAAIFTFCKEQKHFTEDEFNTLSLLASYGAMALSNAHAYHDLQVQATEIKVGFQRVGEALSASLDIAETLRIVLQQAVGMTHADAGAIYMLCEPSECTGLRLAEMRGIDRRSVRRFRLGPISTVAGRAMKERRAVIVPDTRRVTEIPFPTLRISLDETAETRSAICVPLIIGDRALGVLEQYSSEPGVFTQRDAELLVAFAHQASVAVENARLYAQECSIAETLQKAFLPDLPATVANFEIGRVYSPGSHVSAVGGDIYDLFSLPDGRIAALIADVSGQGTYAATLAIMAKYTVRAYALENPEPSSVLARVNDALIEQTPDAVFFTISYALIDPATRQVSIASAAHPPVLHYRAMDRSCVPVATEPGLIAGFLREQEYSTHTFQLEKGDALVFYTDGVIEAPRNKTLFAHERLVRVILDNASLDAQEIAVAIYGAVTDYTDNDRPDDIALLVLKAI